MKDLMFKYEKLPKNDVTNSVENLSQGIQIMKWLVLQEQD